MRLTPEREQEIRKKWQEANGPSGGTVASQECAAEYFEELLSEIDALRAEIISEKDNAYRAEKDAYQKHADKLDMQCRMKISEEERDLLLDRVAMLRGELKLFQDIHYKLSVEFTAIEEERISKLRDKKK